MCMASVLCCRWGQVMAGQQFIPVFGEVFELGLVYRNALFDPVAHPGGHAGVTADLLKLAQFQAVMGLDFIEFLLHHVGREQVGEEQHHQEVRAHQFGGGRV